MYRCEATSVEGFIQQLAVSYIANGYRFYVPGVIPAEKDPRAVDAKLIDRYSIDCSKFVRCRRKKRGFASVQYLRWERVFVLVATPGQHRIFTDEAAVIQNFIHTPFRFLDYAIGLSIQEDTTHPSVRIACDAFQVLKRRFLRVALSDSVETLERRFHQLPFAPYAPIRRQLFGLLSAINRTRQEADLERVAWSAIRRQRKPVRPFAAEPSIRFWSPPQHGDIGDAVEVPALRGDGQVMFHGHCPCPDLVGRNLHAVSAKLPADSGK